LAQIILAGRRFKVHSNEGIALHSKRVKIHWSNKGPGPLQRGDSHKNVKMGWGHLRIFFSRTTRPILTRLGTNHPLLEGI
jgi:hypothetical protein